MYIYIISRICKKINSKIQFYCKTGAYINLFILDIYFINLLHFKYLYVKIFNARLIITYLLC